MMVTGIDYPEATAILKKAGGHVKTAIVMILGCMDENEARKKLKISDGFVHGAISNNL